MLDKPKITPISERKAQPGSLKPGTGNLVNDLKIDKQNRILFNLAWGLALVILGEGYMFSPLASLMARHLLPASSSLFWVAFWAAPVVFLALQSFAHLKALNRFFPDNRRRNRRWAAGVASFSFAALIAILVLILPIPVVHS